MLRARTRSLLRAVLCVALVVGLGACNRGGNGDGDGKASAPTSSDTTRDMKYTATATGALSFSVDGTHKIRVLRIESDDSDNAPVTLLSVGPGVPVDLPDGRKMRAAFDLQRYKGNGSYKIKAGAPRDLLEQSKQGVDPNTLDQSNVLVQVWPAGSEQAQQPQVFDRVLEPCEVTVSRNGDQGHLHCARMEAQGGEFVLDMRWSLP